MMIIRSSGLRVPGLVAAAALACHSSPFIADEAFGAENRPEDRNVRLASAISNAASDSTVTPTRHLTTK
jgi:hypothetical protein